ncbi:nucleoid occlusion protein [Pueribacillus theae]|uniref:Nucleoid occlusion protein n=1 Tax=Pueribacillus theae TaxID=2171751 RepID=A0A2U1JNY2_9BACI|nr:nucleoid occlusion protein [Pueribacillus theae]PWA06705.1 nucleoid occlusion protein [Pueribacillus theae]
MKSSISRLFGLGEKEIEREIKKDEVVQLAISKITPNRYQPRTVFVDEKIEELAQTIKTHGIIQPIIVRKIDGKDEEYEIIAGERRWRAVQKLGWETIPAIIREFSDSQTASVALIENLQREELTAIEEAVAYAKLIEIHGLTQESLAQRLGKGQSTIANKLRLLKLPKQVQDSLLNKEITERHARALIVLKNEEKQVQLLHEIVENQLNVKQTEDKVKSFLEGDKKKTKNTRKAVSKDTRIAVNTIRQSMNMIKDTGISIEMEEENHEDYYQFLIRIPKK